MGLLDEALAFIDARKRAVSNAAQDIYNDPAQGLGLLGTRMGDMVKQNAGGLLNAGMDASSVMPDVQRSGLDRMIPGLLGAGMTVYHGSPHSFDKFDSSKIGTGEGAQVYGHGLYFAENPAVSKMYRDTLSAPKYPSLAVGRDGDKWSVIEAGGSQPLAQFDSKAKAMKHVDGLLGAAEANAPKGALYKVDIPDEHIAKMLDWDKPLSQQPESVQASVKKAFADAKIPDAWRADPDGQSIHAWLSSAMGGKNNGELQRRGASVLRDNGIPGIRYLDAGSRGKGGTSNFVVFDDKLPQILSRE